MSNDFDLGSTERLLNLINKDNVSNVPGIVINTNDVTFGTPSIIEGEKNTELELTSIPNTRTVGSVTIKYNRLDLNGLKDLADIPLSIEEGDLTTTGVLEQINNVYGCNISEEELELFNVNDVDYEGSLITFRAKDSSLAWINEVELLVKLDQDLLSNVFVNTDLRGLSWPEFFYGLRHHFNVSLSRTTGSYSTYPLQGFTIGDELYFASVRNTFTKYTISDEDELSAVAGTIAYTNAPFMTLSGDKVLVTSGSYITPMDLNGQVIGTSKYLDKGNTTVSTLAGFERENDIVLFYEHSTTDGLIYKHIINKDSLESIEMPTVVVTVSIPGLVQGTTGVKIDNSFFFSVPSNRTGMPAIVYVYELDVNSLTVINEYLIPALYSTNQSSYKLLRQGKRVALVVQKGNDISILFLEEGEWVLFETFTTTSLTALSCFQYKDYIALCYQTPEGKESFFLY